MIDRAAVESLLGLQGKAGEAEVRGNTHQRRYLDENTWLRDAHPRLAGFIRRAVEEFDPNFLVLVDRKGRIAEALSLIPSGLADRIVYPAALNWVSAGDSLRDAQVLVITDTVQRGKELSRIRRRLEDRGAEVKTIALVRRRSWFESGLLAEPKVEPCLDLSDEEFARATASLAEVLQGEVLCLDVDHFPTCEFQLTAPLTAEELATALGNLGPIHFVPMPPVAKHVLALTVDRPRFFDWEKLRLPPTFRPEGVCKLRTYYDRNKGTLVIVPVIFPSARLRSSDISVISQSIEETWSRFIVVPEGWSMLGPALRAELIYRLLVIFCGTQLILQALPHLRQLAGLLKIDTSPGGLTIGSAELGRVLGPSEPARLLSLVEDTLRDGWSKISRQAEWEQLSLPLERAENGADLEADGDEYVDDLLRLLSKFAADHEPDQGLSKSEIQAHLNWPERRLSCLLDFCLDRGLIKPLIEVRNVDGIFECLRTYRATEYGSWFEGSNAYTPEAYSARKIAWIIPFILDRLMKSSEELSDGVHDFLRDKVLVNLQHDWDTRRFERLYLTWRPYFFGPVPNVPTLNRPHMGYQTVSQFATQRGVCKLGPQTNKGDRRLVPTGEAWKVGVTRDLDGLERDYLEGLVDIYSEIYRRFGEGTSHNPSVDPLVTLAACRDRRLTYISAYEGLRLWRNHLDLALDALEANLETQDEGVCERPIERATTGRTQMEDKIRRYESLEETKKLLAKALSGHPRASLAAAILDKLPPVEVDANLPYPVGRIKRLAPLLDALTTLIHYSAMKLGMAADRRKAAKRGRDFRFYAERLLKTHAEIRDLEADLVSIGELVESNVRDPRVGHVLRKAMNRTARILDRDLPDPEDELPPGEGSSPLDIFLRDVIEAASRVEQDKQTGNLLIDIHGFIPLSTETAHGLGVPPESVEIVARERIFNILRAILDRMKMKPRAVMPIGGDGWLVCHDDLDELLEVACRLQQTRKDAVPGALPKIAVTYGLPGVVTEGAALGRGFVRAFYLAEKTHLAPGKIRVTKDVVDRLSSDHLKSLLTAEEQVKTPLGTVAIHDVEWHRFGGEADEQ